MSDTCGKIGGQKDGKNMATQATGGECGMTYWLVL